MIIAGGGTGGHLFPGLAVAEALAATGSTDIRFVGSVGGIEARVIPKTRFPFTALPISGLRGRGLRGALTFAFQLPVAVLRAWRILGEFRPHLVLGLGGYGSVPVVAAAWLRGIASILLEQNAHPGMSNRLLAYLAKCVCTTFDSSNRFFSAGKSVLTGNPVRQLESDEKPLPNHFTIFAFGGSQGARSINRAMADATPTLAAELPELRILHQTGAGDVEWVTAKYREIGAAAEVVPFVHEMGKAYGRADLVVCRAGATTLAELMALGKPAILIPYPHAADDHQRANAEVQVRRSAAKMILDKDLNGATLAAAVLELARDRTRLAAMGAAARSLAVPDAVDRVAAVCRQVAGETV
ncbi:MAG: undecaprenyldiphospho-muramoylpentapeptide beta-N-acetylglucosaminyltransferase [Deltaproteobacteria bacterium]|nr:undecaprenyldiphospho-muramoylpentapeptide beta-N-acetylglucosaminyltransferase [Deltaproteobacteria bacterium]